MDREAWRAEVHGITKSQTWLRDWTELNSKICCQEREGSYLRRVELKKKKSSNWLLFPTHFILWLSIFFFFKFLFSYVFSFDFADTRIVGFSNVLFILDYKIDNFYYFFWLILLLGVKSMLHYFNIYFSDLTSITILSPFSHRHI